MYSPVPAPGTGAFSPDGRWWWDGRQWLPAYTPDLLWHFDGYRWVPVPQRARPPRWLLRSGLLWLAALAAWLLYGAGVLAADGGSTPGRVAFDALVGLAGVAVLATCAWGFLVGRRRATRWLWQAAAVGTGVQMGCYGVAMLAAPSPDGSEQDNAAGAGMAILTIPTALILLALLWFGAGFGVLSRRIRQPDVINR